MKKLKNEVGITLIALVITIIVLLILAGVALSMVAGNEGILTKAEKAVNETNIAGAKEQVELMIAELSAEYYEKKYVDKTESGKLVNYIKNALATAKPTSNGEFSVKIDGSGNVSVTDKGGNPVVSGSLDENGKIIWDSSNNTDNTEPETGISEANYGEYVDLGTSLIVNDNIALEDGEVPKADWRIFHKDASGGVWLILADCLPYSHETSAVAGSSTGLGTGLKNGGSSYPYGWHSETSRDDLITRLGNSSAWNNLISSTYTAKGATVTGAVDLETWVESWNASGYTELFTNRYSNVNGSAQSDGLDGYYIGLAENPETVYIDMSSDTGYGDSLYFPHKNGTSRTACYAYWLASPSAHNTRYVMGVHYNGYVLNSYYSDDALGARPAVYLPSGIQLEENAEGIWEVK